MADPLTQRSPPQRLLRLDGLMNPPSPTAQHKPRSRFLRFHDRRIAGIGIRPQRLLSPGKVAMALPTPMTMTMTMTTTPLPPVRDHWVVAERKPIRRSRMATTQRADNQLVRLLRLLRLSELRRPTWPRRNQQPTALPEVHLLRSAMTTPRLRVVPTL